MRRSTRTRSASEAFRTLGKLGESFSCELASTRKDFAIPATGTGTLGVNYCLAANVPNHAEGVNQIVLTPFSCTPRQRGKSR